MKNFISNWAGREIGDQNVRKEFAADLKGALAGMCRRIGFKVVRFLESKSGESFTAVLVDGESKQHFAVGVLDVRGTGEWVNRVVFRPVAGKNDLNGGTANVCRLTQLENELKKTARMFRAA